MLFDPIRAEWERVREALLSELAGFPDAPGEEALARLLRLLFASSLLKEEGRTVRVRVMLAPPDRFSEDEGPPKGFHALHFEAPPRLSPGELKRLSPAADFARSLICVWPDETGAFLIWGLVNSGPRWLNRASGGRRIAQDPHPFPVVQVREPGVLRVVIREEVLSELRGLGFQPPGVDVLHADWLKERFLATRRRLVEELEAGGAGGLLDPAEWAELAHGLAIQFGRRLLSLARSSGHGGTVLFFPDGKEGAAQAARWVLMKYAAQAELAHASGRYRALIRRIMGRLCELLPHGMDHRSAWNLFQEAYDRELDELEESFFELARFYADFMQVDGALVLDHRLQILGFGGEIVADRNVTYVMEALDREGTRKQRHDIRADGTRHRSVYRLCSVEPEAFGFVVSQDGTVRAIAAHEGEVTVWDHVGM
ncbi:MAG: hypothetical protein EA425_17595 [Puniceicoccaceae bacterium]|nr:MAG: hypothetical protein EA425_17595 [Puniceicoccaceae bacterium]